MTLLLLLCELRELGKYGTISLHLVFTTVQPFFFSFFAHEISVVENGSFVSFIFSPGAIVVTADDVGPRHRLCRLRGLLSSVLSLVVMGAAAERGLLCKI